MKNKDTDRRVFDTAFSLWLERGKILDTRRRLKRYTYGDQWGDVVTSADGTRLLESELITKTGRLPVTNNLIRRLVKTIVGRFRDMATANQWYETDPDSYDAVALLEELDSRLLEEFLISGMAIQRVANDNYIFDDSPTVVNVSPEAFFCNDFRDTRGYDIEIAGMLHDMSPAEVLARFGDNDSKARLLEDLMERYDELPVPAGSSSMGFSRAAPGRFRVIEVWTREYGAVGKICWKCRWFTPGGQLLDSYSSPWKHGSHPFVIKFYPLTDGEIHSFVEDVVDQQRYINRLIVLIDRILSYSAKGVLIFPENQRPQRVSWEEIATRWAKPDGIIPITGNTPILPQQIAHSSGDTGAYRLLELELNLFDKTAGVGSALLGSADTVKAFNGAEHYQAQVENATIALADIFRTFRALIVSRNNKLKSL